MTTRDIGENFKIVLSTKKTLFGAVATDFKVYFANVNDLTAKTVVDGGISEAIADIDVPNTAIVAMPAPYGAKLIHIDENTSTLEEGDVIEYSAGEYAYIQRIVADKVYLKTPIKTAVASGAMLTQKGNTGEYTTPDVSIPTVGEYIVAIEGSDYGILVEQRVKVVDSTVSTAVDTDAPSDTVAVAY